MRSENISDAIGMLDGEMLEHALMVRKKAQGREGRGEKKGGRIKYAVAACACLAALSAAAVFFVVFRDPEASLYRDGVPEGSLMAQESPESGNQTNSDAPEDHDALADPRKEGTGPLASEAGGTENFVEVSSLLAARTPGIVSEERLEYARVPVAEYSGFYEKADSAGSDVLAAALGGAVDGAEGWYRISGHSDLQYLIRKAGEEYSLWKFGYFESGEYPYRDVLELVYQVHSAEDLREMEISPPRMDNSGEGKRIQESIGIHTVTDRDALEVLYRVLVSMTCYGSNRWDLIDYGSPEASEDGTMESHDAVKLGRYLAVTTDYGNVIDGLKYTAVSGMFYEFSGVAYNPLTKEQAEGVWEIIGITKEGAQEQDGNDREGEQAAQAPEESGGEEDGYLYEITNWNAGPEAVTELQTRVSGAMIAGELPFVVSSAVYENPCRLHIVVTSREESDIQKLLGLDTLGGVMEIEYTAANTLMLE